MSCAQIILGKHTFGRSNYADIQKALKSLQGVAIRYQLVKESKQILEAAYTYQGNPGVGKEHRGIEDNKQTHKLANEVTGIQNRHAG